MTDTIKYKTRALLIISIIVLSVVSLSIGAKSFIWTDMFKGDAVHLQTLFISRFPRLLSILITGAGLSISGLIMQTITGNKFVSPTTAGTMDWCRLGVLFAILLAGGQSKIFRILIAFIVAFLGNLVFISITQRVKYKSAVMVPLIGLMLGNVVSSLTTFISYKYNLIQNVSSWLQGNFSLVIKGSYELLYIGIPMVFIAYFYAGRFTIAGMGESFATNLGLNYKRIVLLGLLIVSFLTTTIVVTIGSIAFVGLIIPNLVSLYKGDNLKHTLFDTAAVGALFLLICDIIGRIIIHPYEVSISVVVSVLGSIIFLLLIFLRKGKAFKNA